LRRGTRGAVFGVMGTRVLALSVAEIRARDSTSSNGGHVLSIGTVLKHACVCGGRVKVPMSNLLVEGAAFEHGAERSDLDCIPGTVIIQVWHKKGSAHAYHQSRIVLDQYVVR
jgi:hypothetical protein